MRPPLDRAPRFAGLLHAEPDEAFAALRRSEWIGRPFGRFAAPAKVKVGGGRQKGLSPFSPFSRLRSGPKRLRVYCPRRQCRLVRQAAFLHHRRPSPGWRT